MPGKVVKTLKYQAGNMVVTARFHDDAYRDEPPERIQRRIDDFCKFSASILRDAKSRKQENS